ncbi:MULTISPECIES: alkaline phosphatase PhoX [unclassified Microbulbifer]|uniref:alkaline phosphatase PhoX n=1 Tax=unclassified Microbulbifer TaxID=2619833 RepID=UPI0027E49EAB|nr:MULTISPECIES: alkaline phosphatase PhoX [unclassified Microbulbifer]
MNKLLYPCIMGGVALALAQTTIAATDIYFNPLTQSAAVATPDHINELNGPWRTPSGLSQDNLTGLAEAAADVNQSIVRIEGAGVQASMFDMTSFSPDGQYLFIPHETPFGAGISRYDIENDSVEIIFQGDLGGMNGDWSNDYGAFDPSLWTPNNTLFAAEEWTAEGRVVELLNPLAPADQIQARELESIPNVAHEGLRFSLDERTLYFIDEWNSGSVYKLVFNDKDEYEAGGQTFVLAVDAFGGDAAANWNEGINANATRTGAATWVPITDGDGNPLTETDPFRNGPTDDPRSNPDTRGGRGAADEVNGTPFGRPEDMEIGRLANGNEVMYFAATSERTIYSIEMLPGNEAIVRVTASDAETPKNLGFPATTGVMNSPDNLAQDALGNIYVIEDSPNSSDVGGDIWFLRDVDNDGVAESVDHFMSNQVGGSESTGMIFNPAQPTQFVVSVQHPASTDLPEGFGDAIWVFDLEEIVPPACDKYGARYSSTCSHTYDFRFVEQLKRAGKGKKRWRDHGRWFGRH